MSGSRLRSLPSTPTDVAMAIAKLLGFDPCPRLKALKDRHLFLPHGRDIPEILRSICHANIDLAKITAEWEQIVHLVASVVRRIAIDGPADRCETSLRIGIIRHFDVPHGSSATTRWNSV